MVKFETYYNTCLEDRWLTENYILFGDTISDYQRGHGYGMYGTTIYSGSYGNGHGFGHATGNGNELYPYQLVQYWKW